MASSPTREQLNARFVANAALVAAAGISSTLLDKLACWSLAALGAGLALILSNLSDLAGFIETEAVVTSGFLFSGGALLCFLQRYLSMMISSGAQLAKEARSLRGIWSPVDEDELMRQIFKGIPAPLRWLYHDQFDSLKAGDIAAGGRSSVRLSLFQATLVTLEMGLILAAVVTLIDGISV